MKDLIKKLLKEVMTSELYNWKDNINIFNNDNTFVITTLISKDYKSNNKFYLFVGLTKDELFSEYSYCFMLLDGKNNPITDYITKKSEVTKYLPEEIKNKKLIFPIIKDMTRKLMDSYLPQNIFRKTIEPIQGDSLIRYEEITNIMVNEYGYKLTEKSTDNFGYTIWKLNRNKINDNNKDMNESYVITHVYSSDELHKKMFDWVLPKL
jgi:hypothetical protein